MPQINFVQDFGSGSTSFINFGTVAALQSGNIRSELALVRPSGPGGGNNGYIVGRAPSASVNGHRMFLTYTTGDARLAFGKSSSSAGNPQASTPDGSIAYGEWQYFAATHNGTVNGSTGNAMKILHCLQAATIAETATYRTRTNGSGTLSSNSSDSFHMGNRPGGDRGLNGKIAFYVAWSVELTQAEYEQAQADGPLSVQPDNILICWANGQDYGPLGLTPVSTGDGVTSDSTTLPANLELGGAEANNFDATTETRSESSGTLTTSILCAATALALSFSTADLAPPASTTEATSYTVSASSGDLLTGITCSAISASTSSSTADLAQGVFTIVDTGERISIDAAQSQVIGLGDDAIIELFPVASISEVWTQGVWTNPMGRVDGMVGYRPTLRWLEYRASASVNGTDGYPYPSTRRMMFAPTPDGPWQYFDTGGTGGTERYQFRHNTAFTPADAGPSGEIYIARSRCYTVTGIGNKIAALAAAHPTLIHPSPAAVAHTPTANVAGWPAQDFISGEFSPQTGLVGRAIPHTPQYSFTIRDDSLTSERGGPKQTMIFTGEVHAGEDHASFVLDAVIDAVLSNTAWGINIRKHAVIHVIRCAAAPGRYGGHSRSTFQRISNTDDMNRHMHEASSLETVVKMKSAVLACLGGDVAKLGIDWHGAKDNIWAIYIDGTSIYHTRFDTALEAYQGIGTIDDNGESSAGFVSRYFRTLGTKYDITHETGDHATVTQAQIANHGIYSARAISDLIDADAFDLYLAATTQTASASSGDLEVSAPPNTLDALTLTLSASSGDLSAGIVMQAETRAAGASAGDLLTGIVLSSESRSVSGSVADLAGSEQSLSVVSQSSSASSADLQTGIALTVVAGSQLSASGELDARILMTAQAASGSASTGDLAESSSAFSAYSRTGSESTGEIVTGIMLSASAESVSESTADYVTPMILSAVCESHSYSIGLDLLFDGNMTARTESRSASSGDMQAGIVMTGTVSAASSSVAALDSGISPMEAECRSASASSGDLQTAVRLAVRAVTESESFGDMTTGISLSATSASASFCTGKLAEMFDWRLDPYPVLIATTEPEADDILTTFAVDAGLEGDALIIA